MSSQAALSCGLILYLAAISFAISPEKMIATTLLASNISNNDTSAAIRISAAFLPSLLDLQAFGETAESVVRDVNFRDLTPPRQSLFAALGCGCVSVMILLRIVLICCCFGFRSELFQSRFVLKRRSENQCKKNVKRGAPF